MTPELTRRNLSANFELMNSMYVLFEQIPVNLYIYIYKLRAKLYLCLSTTP